MILIKLGAFWENYQFLRIVLGKIKKGLWFIGREAFLFILIFILLEIIIGELLFYNYVSSIEKISPQISSSVFEFKQEAYQSILKEWQERELIWKNISAKNYPDPFK